MLWYIDLYVILTLSTCQIYCSLLWTFFQAPHEIKGTHVDVNKAVNKQVLGLAASSSRGGVGTSEVGEKLTIIRLQIWEAYKATAKAVLMDGVADMEKEVEGGGQMDPTKILEWAGDFIQLQMRWAVPLTTAVA